MDTPRIGLPLSRCMHALTLRAGPAAFALLRERGLRAEDVDVIPGASGGPKWLAIAGLDRYIFSAFLAAPRTRAMALIGSSIGSWRMACLAQTNAVAALDRAHHAYIHAQNYGERPTPSDVSRVSHEVLAAMLGVAGADEILTHPWARLHIITSQGSGLANHQHGAQLGMALAAAAALNLVSRRSIAWQFHRHIFHAMGEASPLSALSDLPTTHVPLTPENLRSALLASGSIPMVIDGVSIPSAPGGLHWDGGVTDYHLDLNFGPGNGLVLYPHFYPQITPGWFDKSLPWRRASVTNFRRALILAPSAEFVATLPRRKIPDRSDFAAMSHNERIAIWETVRSASTALGDELGELVASGKIAERTEVWR
jgi:hypothetical protein